MSKSSLPSSLPPSLPSSPPGWRWLAVALAGPILTGVVLGLRAGPRAMAVFALGLPVIVALVTLLTTPTLYVGGAVFGTRLSLAEVGAATARALHGLGLALLGLVPLDLLLVATWPEATIAPAQSLVLLVVGMTMGVHRLGTALGEEMGDRPRPVLAGGLLLAAHATIAFVIGARLFVDLHRLAEGVSS